MHALVIFSGERQKRNPEHFRSFSRSSMQVVDKEASELDRYESGSRNSPYLTAALLFMKSEYRQRILIPKAIHKIE